MNRLQLVQRLYRELGRSGAGPTSSATASTSDLRLFDWVDDASEAIEAEKRAWKWKQRSLDAPINLIDMAYTGIGLGAADFGRWRKAGEDYTVRCYLPAIPSNVWRLTWMNLDEFKRRYVDVPFPAAQPRYWTIDEQERLLISPVADQIYSVRADYFTAPVRLTDDADEPGMPIQYHLIHVWRALVEGGKYDAAPETLARAAENHRDIRYALEEDQSPEMVWNMRPLL